MSYLYVSHQWLLHDHVWAQVLFQVHSGVGRQKVTNLDLVGP